MRAGRQADQQFSVYEADLIDPDNPWRHDSLKLAERLIKIYEVLKANIACRENDRLTDAVARKFF